MTADSAYHESYAAPEKSKAETADFLLERDRFVERDRMERTIKLQLQQLHDALTDISITDLPSAQQQKQAIDNRTKVLAAAQRISKLV